MFMSIKVPYQLLILKNYINICIIKAIHFLSYSIFLYYIHNKI